MKESQIIRNYIYDVEGSNLNFDVKNLIESKIITSEDTPNNFKIISLSSSVLLDGRLLVIVVFHTSKDA